jgi:serine O-acetyltransferase
MFRKVIQDALEMTRACGLPVDASSLKRTVLETDSFPIMAIARARELARTLRIPLANRLLRYGQTVLFGIEIGKDVTLGPGVYFVHTVGTVIGGDARIGARVRFMGNNTVGTAKDNGYPTIEDDVEVGVGARILGPVRIGRGAKIGANAVVVRDVPAGAVAAGIPARVLKAPEEHGVVHAERTLEERARDRSSS